MGHLTLISEDVITAMEHSTPELRLVMAQYTPQPEWDDYVTGRYQETKTKDTSLLGGGKPAVSLAARPGNGWKVDEQDIGGSSALMPAARAIANRVEESRGEFRRSAAARREGSADFGPVVPMDEDNDSGHTAVPQIGAHPQVRLFNSDFMKDFMALWPACSIISVS
jgi:serine/threonine-protein phosphatase 6 regulatory subunit 3